MADDHSSMTVDLLTEELKRMKHHRVDTLDLSINQVKTLLEDIEERAIAQYAEGLGYGRRHPVHSTVPR